jgi:hypothetical protein
MRDRRSLNQKNEVIFMQEQEPSKRADICDRIPKGSSVICHTFTDYNLTVADSFLQLSLTVNMTP